MLVQPHPLKPESSLRQPTGRTRLDTGGVSPSERPNLVTTDLSMPMMSGEDFLQRGQSLLRGAYVMVLSGSHVESDISIPHHRMITPGSGEKIDQAVATLKNITARPVAEARTS